MLRRILFFISFLTAAQAFAATRGTLLQATLLGTWSKEQLDVNFQRYGLQARYGIQVFRVNYESEIAPGVARPTEASGLVIVPVAAEGERPWISVQHGTVAGKQEAPSQSPSEGMYEASQGFVAAVPDYLGYGSSATLFHPYLIAEAYVPVGVDLLRATRTLAAQHGITLGKLFLKGYSEGGYATMVLQKALETVYADEFKLTASAPAAGPYDLDIAATTALSRPNSNALISSFLLLAYDQWLAPDINLDEIFAIDANQLQDLYNSGLSSSEILRALPNETRKLVDGTFLDDFLASSPQSEQARLMHRLLVEQSLIHDNWVPSTPTRLYHCSEDEIVAVQATHHAIAHFKALNADAPVTEVIATSPDANRPYTHGTCPLAFSSVAWFSEILSR